MINILFSVALFAVLKSALLKLGAFCENHKNKARTWRQRGRYASLFR